MKTIIPICILLILSIACTDKVSKEKEASPSITSNKVILTDAQYENAHLETTALEEKNIATVLKLNGKVSVLPQNLVSVSVPLGGYLLKTDLLPGMYVKKGSLLATMEDPQYIQLQQEYLLTKSKLQLAEAEYNRQKELNKSQAGSDKILQQAETEINSQRINLNALTVKLRLINKNPETISAKNISKNINVYSPISGYVSEVNFGIGKYVNSTDVLFELINPDNFILILKAYEGDITKLQKGQRVNVYSNNQPEVQYSTEIISINKDVSSEGTFNVYCKFSDSKNTDLYPGMYLNAEAKIFSHLANVLPEESIVAFEGKDYVFTEISKLHYQMEEVSVGEIENGLIALHNADFLKNKKIVTKGAYTLLMKLKNTEE